MISSDILLRRAYKITKAVFRLSHLRQHFLGQRLLLAIIKKKLCGDGFPLSWLMANVRRWCPNAEGITYPLKIAIEPRSMLKSWFTLHCITWGCHEAEDFNFSALWDLTLIFQFEEVIIRPQAGHGRQSEKTGFRIIRVTFDQGGMTARYWKARWGGGGGLRWQPTKRH